ncbi:MAG: hypothetical protein AAGB48_00870 [Planctomycetota bacterium]
MDFAALLDSLKGKALDVKDIEMIKHSYGLQSKVVEQLEKLNAAHVQSNDLLQKKVSELETEAEVILERVRFLESEAVKLSEAPKDNSDLDDDDVVSLHESWMGSRDPSENLAMMRFDEVDRIHRLAPGAAKRCLEKAGMRWSYRVGRKTEKTIIFRPSNAG